MAHDLLILQTGGVSIFPNFFKNTAVEKGDGMNFKVLFFLALIVLAGCGGGGSGSSSQGGTNGIAGDDSGTDGRGGTPLPRTSNPYQRPVQVGVAGGTAQGRDVTSYRMIHNLGETFNKNASPVGD